MEPSQKPLNCDLQRLNKGQQPSRRRSQCFHSAFEKEWETNVLYQDLWLSNHLAALSLTQWKTWWMHHLKSDPHMFLRLIGSNKKSPKPHQFSNWRHSPGEKSYITFGLGQQRLMGNVGYRRGVDDLESNILVTAASDAPPRQPLGCHWQSFVYVFTKK